ncbi:MAG: Myb-like DNA-binding domain-containing protein [Janthinobacterium lividum]
MPASSTHRPQPIAHPSPTNERPSTAWSQDDDVRLMQFRTQGMNWAPIASYFNGKSANACRKRHERLMEKKNNENYDTFKVEDLGNAYLECREEMWKIMAARLGESKWQTIETKVLISLPSFPQRTTPLTNYTVHGKRFQEPPNSCPRPAPLPRARFAPPLTPLFRPGRPLLVAHGPRSPPYSLALTLATNTNLRAHSRPRACALRDPSRARTELRLPAAWVSSLWRVCRDGYGSDFREPELLRRGLLHAPAKSRCSRADTPELVEGVRYGPATCTGVPGWKRRECGGKLCLDGARADTLCFFL